MAKKLQYVVQDVECAVLNEEYITKHFSLTRPNISPELKAQVVLNERGKVIKVACSRYSAQGRMNQNCERYGGNYPCIFEL